MEVKTKEMDSIVELIETNYFNKTTGILKIPEGTEVIKGKFFYRKKDINKLNRVKGIIIPNSVKKIGKYAFRRTGITEIKIPNSVQEIELGAFEWCENLYEISIDGKNIPIIEDDAFIACNRIERFYNLNGNIDIKSDIRISNSAFCTSPNLVNETGKWLLVVNDKESKISAIIAKIKSVFSYLLKLNNAEKVDNKF